MTLFLFEFASILSNNLLGSLGIFDKLNGFVRAGIEGCNLSRVGISFSLFSLLCNCTYSPAMQGSTTDGKRFTCV